MKTVSNKRRYLYHKSESQTVDPTPIFRQGVTIPPIPYTNLESIRAGTSTPCTETQKEKNPRTSGRKELTLVEEVEEYLRMEATKEKATKNKK